MHLKQFANRKLVRDSYNLSKSLSIKIYHGKYQGLIRAEVEFGNETEAKKYLPEPWMGKEITETRLGKDSLVVSLSSTDFKAILNDL